MWERIVLNLVSNAFKFTFEGEIRVRLERCDGEAVLTVSDTGTGIAAPDLEGLFVRFRRVRNARSRTHEGSGIGLALVQELVRLHDGDVHVESAFGEGSTFTVRIPVGDALRRDRRRRADQRAPPRTSRRRCAGSRRLPSWVATPSAPG